MIPALPEPELEPRLVTRFSNSRAFAWFCGLAASRRTTSMIFAAIAVLAALLNMPMPAQYPALDVRIS